MADRLIELFSEILDVPHERLNNNSSPDNIKEWDSLAAINLAAAIEDAFTIELTTQEITKMRTIGIVREVLREKGVIDV